MNQKIQSLIDGGFITISDVIEWANQYTEEQEAKIAMEFMYEPDFDPFYEMTEEERTFEEMRMLDDMYGDDLIEPTQEDLRSPNPQYIVASTAYYMEETYVFEANENGQITNYSEYSGITKRFGCDDWQDYYKAVEVAFGKDKYQFVRRLDTLPEVAHFLFKRVNHEQNCEPEYPLPSDTWDGGFVQEP